MSSESPQRDIAFDCRYFRNDRPCVWHKQTGVVCQCEHYQAIAERVLIIKLDAMGDVLRSTALLPAIAETHPHACITWITRRESAPLLQRNPYVAEVIEYGADALLLLQTRTFDRVINLDASSTSAALASAARSARRDGFVLDERGVVRPTNAAAQRWFEMGLFDDLKRSNASTYQDLMTAILATPGQPHRYVLEISADERGQARRHLKEIGVLFDRPVIGLNTGAGGRWPLKQWREEGYIELIQRLAARHRVQFVLLGGPGERERHQRLTSLSAVPLIDSGCDNAVRHFAAIVSHCDVVVSGDTLAMHIALALECRSVVLFGPTSVAEIDMYDLGEKVAPNMACLACYKTACDFVPNCMDLITVEMVEQAVTRQLELSANRKLAHAAPVL